jgi:hypothetical protein
MKIYIFRGNFIFHIRLLVDKMFVLITMLYIELTEKIPFCYNSHLNTYVTSLECT